MTIRLTPRPNNHAGTIVLFRESVGKRHLQFLPIGPVIVARCRRNVVEFRHGSWWNEDVYAAFRETGTIFCSCSGPLLPDALIKTADDIYIRFHGLTRWYRHDYTKEELTGSLIVAVINFPPKRIAGFISEVLVLGIENEYGEVVLLKPEREVGIGMGIS